MNTKKIMKHLGRPQNLLYRILYLYPQLIKSDSLYLRMRYSLSHGETLHLKKPVTFGEKLQWLKLYNRQPEYTKMVDKYHAKSLVASIVGGGSIIPTIAVYNDVSEINWDVLPNQFVLKTTHDSGGIVICRDKSKLDKDSAIKKLNYAITHDNYTITREWPYKNVQRRIIAEEYIAPDDGHDDLTDYKWFCFDGEPYYCQVIQDRKKKETIDFFDKQWNHQPFIGMSLKANNAPVQPKCPVKLNEMVEIARQLSEGIPFARIDLYEVRGRVYFGEITFFPASGFGSFRPKQYNKIIGDLIKLPIK